MAFYEARLKNYPLKWAIEADTETEAAAKAWGAIRRDLDPASVADGGYIIVETANPEELPIYTAERWAADRSFSAMPGQEVTAEIYEDMFNCMPPYRLPRDTILAGYTCGFMMGEPHSTDPATGKQLYLAFAKRENGKYYYIGLRAAR